MLKDSFCLNRICAAVRAPPLSPSAASPPPFCVKTNLLFCSEPETIESTNVTAARQGLLQKEVGSSFKP